MEKETVSLARALSKLGYCSRARAPLIIKSGRVRVNGRMVRIPSFRLDVEKDVVEVDSTHLVRPGTIAMMLNKPAGYVTTASDELSRNTVYDLIPRDQHLFPIGRLDIYTSGLLLFTNSGDLQNRIISLSGKVTKTYKVTVNGTFLQTHIDKFLKGIEIESGIVLKADSCKVVLKEFSRTSVELKIHEGKNRQVRQMFEAIGRGVTHLQRTAIGALELEVTEGSWRRLSEEEIELIFE